MIDYYNLLGVPPEAPPARIREAFRTQAKRAHPDAHPHATATEREVLKRRFIQLAQAYEILGDPERRRRYDRERHLGGFRPAQGRTSAPHAARHSGERAQPGEEARPRWRGTAATPPGGKRKPEPPGEGENLESLLRDAGELLGRFGLDLRQPLEVLLEALFEWAKTVFRQVLEGWESAGNTQGPAGTSRDQTGREHTTGGRSAAGGPSGPAHKDRDAADAAVEAELAALKRRMRSRAKGSRGKPSSRAPGQEPKG